MDKLSDELVVSIFEKLDYRSLKLKIPLVCKSFHRIVERGAFPSIDKLLWRDVPLPLSSASPTPIPHPALRQCEGYRFKYYDIESVYYKPTSYYESPDFHENEYGPPKLINHKVRFENATSPATDTVVLHVQSSTPGTDEFFQPFPVDDLFEPGLEIRGTGEGGAVTVLDVMKGVVEVGVRCLDNDIYPRKRLFWWSWDGNVRLEIEDGVLHMWDELARMRPKSPVAAVAPSASTIEKGESQ